MICLVPYSQYTFAICRPCWEKIISVHNKGYKMDECNLESRYPWSVPLVYTTQQDPIVMLPIGSLLPGFTLIWCCTSRDEGAPFGNFSGNMSRYSWINFSKFSRWHMGTLLRTCCSLSATDMISFGGPVSLFIFLFLPYVIPWHICMPHMQNIFYFLLSFI